MPPILSNMRILVIGAGATGGYYGAKLQAAGRDVTFFVRTKRAEQLRKTGLQITGVLGDLTVQPKLLTVEELSAKQETFDLILLSTKAYSLQAAMEDFAPAVGENTLILPLLNGMSHLDTLAERFGKQHVLGGTTRIVSDMDAEGRVVNLEPLHDLAFGEIDKQVTPRIQAVAAALSNAGFDDALSDDIVDAMWQKWIMLASMAGISCLLRGTIGEAAAVKGGTETERGIITECIAVATAEGHAPTPAYSERIYTRLTAEGSKLTASMYRDLSKGQPVEVEHILGDFIARGERHGVQTPLLRACYVQLAMYQARLG
jgi:2-dehydropantoate 2-reductase